LNADGKNGWDRAIAHVRASCAESQLRLAARNMLQLLQSDDDAIRQLKADFETARAGAADDAHPAGVVHGD